MGQEDRGESGVGRDSKKRNLEEVQRRKEAASKQQSGLVGNHSLSAVPGVIFQ